MKADFNAIKVCYKFSPAKVMDAIVIGGGLEKAYKQSERKMPQSPRRQEARDSDWGKN
jgi:hypothetical protein